MEEIEKVIEELKQLEHCITKSCDETCKYYEDDMYHCHYDVSVEETVDEAIQTIRELQSKEDDVCEWKYTKEIMDNAEFKVGCNTNALKRGVVPNNFSYHNFKYCPYCGKKIKVVE